MTTTGTTRRLRVVAIAATVALVCGGPARPIDEAPVPILKALAGESQRLAAWVESDPARAFLRSVSRLPEASAREIYRDPDEPRRFYAARERAELPDEVRSRLEVVTVDAATYYTTRYGSPLAYVRAVDLAAEHGFAGFAETRIVDYGYGTVGHLRLMALAGATAVGVDVDSYLTALYSERDDQGRLGSGRVKLVDGFWPGAPEVRKAVGRGFELFLSKNTLKRGYIHPERPVDENRRLNLGVDDEAFLRAVYRTLRAGGLFVVYNLSPAQNPPDKPYLPWADGRFPFDRELVERVGFEILAFDADDSPAARELGGLLEWDKTGMDLKNGLFAHYTVLRRPE